MSAYNEKSKDYTIAYAKQNLKRIPLDLKLADYEALKAAAQLAGLPINTFIKSAIAEKIKATNKAQAKSK